MSSTESTSSTDDLTRRAPQRGWRVVDIVVTAILAVAVGLVFWAFSLTIGKLWAPIDAVLPGLAGIITGVWLLGGPLGGLVVRKPGAAFLVELLAAVFESTCTEWGVSAIYSGLAQGLGAELVFLLFAYKKWNLPVAVLSGIGAAVGAWVNEYFRYNHGMGAAYNGTYLVCLVVSGAVLAGALAWVLTRALANAGALDRFAAGREARVAR